MAITEMYVDSSLVGDTGDGTIGTPYSNIRLALTNLDLSSNGARINVKGTTSGAPETDLGTIPTTGTTVAKPLIFQPYNTAAGDTTDMLYLDAGGSDAVWSAASLDYVYFNHCYFQNTAGGAFYTLDNNITAYRCVYDRCTSTAASTNANSAYQCKFLNQKGDYFCFYSGGGVFINNYVHFTGGGAGFVACYADTAIGNVFYGEEGTNRLLSVSSTNSMVCHNIFAYSSTATVGTRNGIQLDDGCFAYNNYFENCQTGIIYQASSMMTAVLNNTFFNCTTNVGSAPATSINMIGPEGGANNISLASSGLADLANEDFTPTTALTDAAENDAVIRTAPAGGFFGSFLGAYIPNTAGVISTGGGGSYYYIPRIRTIN